jgi:hypothetical protein
MLLAAQVRTLIQTFRINTLTPSLVSKATSEPTTTLNGVPRGHQLGVTEGRKIKNLTTSEMSGGRAFQARNVPEKRITHSDRGGSL